MDYVFYIALDQNNNIYFIGSYKNYLTCLNPDGSLKWRYNKVNIRNGPVIGDDNTIYIISSGLSALYPNGTVKWENPYYD